MSKLDEVIAEMGEDEERDTLYCYSCGYAWAVHDTRDPLAEPPFGCPTEIVARLRWGRE
jgi:hypothetical protein